MISVDMEKAVELWCKAGEYRNGKPVLSKEERKTLYQQAVELAGSNKELMRELTRRGVITWAF